MMDTLLARARRDDTGFTLIELLVYSALLLLVLGVVGSLMISGITNQARITDTTFSTTESQTATEAVGRGVRSATAMNSPSATVPLLIVKTKSRDAAGADVCQAWFYSAAERTIRTMTKSATDGVVIGVPSPTQLTTWTLLAENVDPPADGSPVFEKTGTSSIEVSFTVASDSGVEQIAHTSFTSRQPRPVESAPECFS